MAIFGSLLTGTGLILSSFSNHLWEITLAYGLLVGTLSTLTTINFLVCRNCSAIRNVNVKRFPFFTFLPWNAGVGLGLINPSSFIAVNSYFSTKRGQAVGLALAGTGVGQMVMPHVVRILLDYYGFKGTILIMGALAFNGVIIRKV